MIPKNSGFRYQDENGNSMVELYIDFCHHFAERANKETEYRGWVSIQKAEEEPALMMFGHDECIFKQFYTTNKSWKASNGETLLMPKDDGQGVMISAFQSSEFGVGRQLTEQELTLVNNYHANQKCANEKAAKATEGEPICERI
jgi:hypothetical protein